MQIVKGAGDLSSNVQQFLFKSGLAPTQSFSSFCRLGSFCLFLTKKLSEQLCTLVAKPATSAGLTNASGIESMCRIPRTFKLAVVIHFGIGLLTQPVTTRSQDAKSIPETTYFLKSTNLKDILKKVQLPSFGLTNSNASIWAASSWPLLLASDASIRIDFPLPMAFRESPSEVAPIFHRSSGN
eukprot:s670_g15.t1